ncbi:nucleotidyltransferase domain-containing protein [Archaeoglobus fulgidus]|uniref:nucleotidyltransferase domain-containing protein n=1 Tax=Archaeoglobus fulgidus TaxID=2234 RepID=UPI00214D9987|nr:nucleotidyltransferase domain-containing protein [Archaeoglobus fulgidus]
MEFLRDVYERRKKYFDNLEEFLKEIKEITRRDVQDAEMYLYGSVVEGDYSIGLSDIDIAIVSDIFKDRNRKLEFFGKITKKFFDSPFEFHILTKKEWKMSKRFIRKYRRLDLIT